MNHTILRLDTIFCQATRRILTFALAPLLAAGSIRAADSLDKKVENVLSQMSLEEKVAQLNLGKPKMYLGLPNDRLGVPATLAADGPRGPNSGDGTDRVCYPAALAYAATWDTALIEKLGVVFGKQLIESHRNQLYSPGVNMVKHPLAGRNAEYFGEDPYLAGRIAAAECRGIQSVGCVATVKHFICNDFEAGRNCVNVDVPERPFRELYLRAFEVAVKEGKPLSVMTSYNSVNGHFSSANALNLTALRKDCGFDGFIISDWSANMESTAAALNAGSNQELSGWKTFKLENIKAALADGSLKPEVLDQRVREVLKVKLRPGFYNGADSKDPVDQEAKREIAKRVGEESMVLLKNEGALLPIKPGQSVALIGPFADGEDFLGADNGSASITPERVVTPLAEFQRRLGDKLTYARGCGSVELGDEVSRGEFACKAEYFNNINLSGSPVLTRDEGSIQKFSFSGEGLAKPCDGVVGKALSFGGQSAWQAGVFPAQKADGDFSIALWVALDAAFLNEKPFLSGQSSTRGTLQVSGMGAKVTGAEKGKAASIKFRMQLQKWTHVALVRSGGKLTVWLDGKSAGEVPMDFATSSMPLILGGDAAHNRFAQARVDDLRVYSRGLTPEEIAQLVEKKNVDAGLALHADCDTVPEGIQTEGYPGITDPHAMSARWTGTFTPKKSGRHAFQILSNGGVRLFLNGKNIFDNWGENIGGGNSMIIWPEMKAGEPYEFKIEFATMARLQWGSGYMRLNWFEPDLAAKFEEAMSAAKGKDLAVVMVGVQQALLQGESNDNEWFELPGIQQELIQAVQSVNPHTAVVLFSSGGVDMKRWLDKTPSVLEAFYPGQEAGRSLADVLFGDVNPSGKLPVTYTKTLDDLVARVVETKYPDTVCEFGYRHFDQKKIEPLFPFGHGLSYTTFEYSDLKVNKGGKKGAVTSVTVTVKNTGKVFGGDVVQIYVGQPKASVERPVRELKGFQKVFLKPGESRQVEIALDPRAFAFWDIVSHGWKVEPGEFVIGAGSSSRDIRLTKTVRSEQL